MTSNGHTPAIKSEQLKVRNGSISLIAPTPLLHPRANAIHQNFHEPYRHRNLSIAALGKASVGATDPELHCCRDGRLPADLAGSCSILRGSGESKLSWVLYHSTSCHYNTEQSIADTDRC